MSLSEISIRKPVLATMMNLALVLFGVIGMSRLPVRELPDVDPPIINVSTIYPGASAAVIETQITEPIEGVLTSIEGIKIMTSESREQFSSITIQFDLSRPVDIAAQDVRDRVARVRAQLPDEVNEPIVAKQDADAQPIMWIALFSDRYSTLELTTLAENTLKDPLQTVPGVSNVILGGSKRFAIRLWLDSDEMAAHGVSVLDVETALHEQNIELPSGKIESWQREMSIETKGELKTPEEYDDLIIKQDGDKFVRLKDIGHAAIGVEDEKAIARFNSKPALGLGIVKQSKANTIDVVDGVKKELERLKPLLPEGVLTEVPYDEAIYVEKSIHEVWETLFISFLLVVITIYIFLHNVQATLIPTVTIPVSILTTFAALSLMGYSINIITMLAFVLAIGLVVDDAIVVLENIYRHIEEGTPPFEAAIKGIKEITFAVIATTVVLGAVFLPMAFQTSTTGRLFIEFAVAISFSVFVSAFVALTLAPMIAARVLKPHSNTPQRGILGFFERSIDSTIHNYRGSLERSLRAPWLIIIVTVVALIAAIFFYKNLDREFLPDEDKGRLLCFVLTPQGSTAEYTDRMIQKMEKIIASTPEVEGYFSAVALAMGGPGQSSQGLAFLRLKDKRERHLRDIIGGPTGLQARFFGEIEGALAFPIVPKSIGRGFTQPFQLVIQSQDLKALNGFAIEFSNVLRQQGFLMNVRSTFELNKPELRVNIDRNRAAALGISVEDISRTLQILFGGLDLSKLNIAGKEYDVIVQLERESRLQPTDLDKIYVRNNKEELIQLSNVVTYETGGGPSSISHYNRLRSATIEGTAVGVPLGTALERTEALLKEHLPSGFRYEWAGESNDLKEAGGQLFFIIMLAMIVVYMVLAAQFESLIHPLTVMVTIPLAATGAFGALWLINLLDKNIASGGWLSHFMDRVPAMGLNLFSQIGIVLLVGLVTKNAILLVDFANQEKARGASAIDAMIEAGAKRFRPIIMTAVATIAGILPIAIGFGAGAESRRPLGVAVVGGMITSTILTLYVVPFVYVMFDRIFSRRKGNKGKPISPKSVLSVLIIMIFLTGCAVGPNYKRPTVTAPSTWKNLPPNTKYATPSDTKHRGDWWLEFTDETLNELEEKALKNNQTLKGALATVEQARALARVSRADFYPDVEANPSVESFRTGDDFGGERGEIYQTPFDISYEIDLWGKVRRAYESARADAQAELAGYQSLMLLIQSDLAENYFNLRNKDIEVDILEKTIEFRQDALHLVQQRFDAGITSELDLVRVKTELAEAESDLYNVRRERAEFENAIAVLCGQSPSTFSLEAEPQFVLQVPRIPTAVPSSLLERRPDIAQAERELISANAQIGVAEGAFYPAITLTGNAGFESLKIDNLFDWGNRAWSVGPSVNLPIFKGGRNKANLERAKAEFDENVANYRQTILVAFREVEDALVNLDLRAKQAERQELVVTAARQAAKISRKRYEEGLVNFLEVVDAERSRLDAEVTAAQIENNRLISAVRLIKALGGSW